MRKLLPISLVLAVLLVLSARLSVAQGPAPQTVSGPQSAVGNDFTYQGELKKNGSSIDATCAMTFTLYDDATVGSPVGTPVNANVAVTDGLFTVALDFGSAIWTGQARWLEVAVKCPEDDAASTLDPRQALTAAPYALSLQPGAVISGTVLAAPLGRQAVLKAYNSASISAAYGLYGLSDSTSGTGVRGYATANSGTTYGVAGRVDSPDGQAVHGQATATTGNSYGLYGESASTAGRAVYGLATAPSGINYGVVGHSLSPEGCGVYGIAAATTGENYGVYGHSNSAAGSGVRGYAGAVVGLNYGVYGQSDSTAGNGVYGYASATTGTTYGVAGRVDSPDGSGVRGHAAATVGNAYGVYGQSDSTAGYGVYGYAAATTGVAYGVYGRSASPNGTGVRGYAAATTGTAYGVYGRADSPDGMGVRAYAAATTGATYGVYALSDSTAGTAVYGYAWKTSGATYGVYGRSDSTAGYGVYYVGGLGGIGLKTSIVETQDHGWRQFYSMESPAVLFEDVGSAKLVGGQAIVPIDPIFAQTVNLEQPYQVFLTPQGAYCALYVAEKTSVSFTVRSQEGASCDIAFDYRIVAKRLGYEDVRAAPAADPTLTLRDQEATALQEP
jgi:hypothetical protein